MVGNETLLRRELTAAEPGSDGLTRDVAVSLTNLGDVARAQGRLDEAFAQYAVGLELHPDSFELLSNRGVAYAMRGDEERLLAVSGADGYLSKPFPETRVLLERVQSFLDQLPGRQTG